MAPEKPIHGMEAAGPDGRIKIPFPLSVFPASQTRARGRAEPVIKEGGVDAPTDLECQHGRRTAGPFAEGVCLALLCDDAMKRGYVNQSRHQNFTNFPNNLPTSSFVHNRKLRRGSQSQSSDCANPHHHPNGKKQIVSRIYETSNNPSREMQCNTPLNCSRINILLIVLVPQSESSKFRDIRAAEQDHESRAHVQRGVNLFELS